MTTKEFFADAALLGLAIELSDKGTIRIEGDIAAVRKLWAMNGYDLVTVVDDAPTAREVLVMRDGFHVGRILSNTEIQAGRYTYSYARCF